MAWRALAPQTAQPRRWPGRPLATLPPPPDTPHATIAFIGAGWSPAGILAIDPGDAARQNPQADLGVRTQSAADAALAGVGLVVWAVKPQLFTEAAAPCTALAAGALHLSVMAGIRSDAIARAMDLRRPLPASCAAASTRRR